MQSESSPSPAPTKGNGKWSAERRAALSKAMKAAHAKKKGPWKRKSTTQGRSAGEVHAREKKIATLLDKGMSIGQIAELMQLTESTVYKYKALLGGRPYRGKAPRESQPQPSAQLRVPMHIYTLAKNLRRAVRAHIMAQQGDVDDLAMGAIALTRELLGE